MKIIQKELYTHDWALDRVNCLLSLELTKEEMWKIFNQELREKQKLNNKIDIYHGLMTNQVYIQYDDFMWGKKHTPYITYKNVDCVPSFLKSVLIKKIRVFELLK